MKVTLEKDYDIFYTVNEHTAAKAVIKSCKEDCATAKEYFEMGLRAILNREGGSLHEIYSATATTCRNCFIEYNSICDGSRNIDVMIEGVAYIFNADHFEFVRAGIRLTDIWAICNGELPNANYYMTRYKQA